jgi:hypothetical protein
VGTRGPLAANSKGSDMHKSVVYSLFTVLTISLAVPASAQFIDREVPPGGLALNDSECQAQFNRADRNGDGVLTPREVSNRRGLIPPRLTQDGGVISRQQFMSACSEDTPRALESGGN